MVQLCQFKVPLYHLPCMGSWASYQAPLFLGFPICNMGIIRVPNPTKLTYRSNESSVLNPTWYTCGVGRWESRKERLASKGYLWATSNEGVGHMYLKRKEVPALRNSLTKTPMSCSEATESPMQSLWTAKSMPSSSPFKPRLEQHCPASLKWGGAWDWLWLMKCE